MTWSDLVDKASNIYPDKVALVDGVPSFTYGELRDKVDRFAVALMNLASSQGLGPPPVPNWHEYIISFLPCRR